MFTDINDRIRELRNALDLSQEAFGQKIGLSRSEVKNIEYKKTAPKENKIPLICEKYNVNEIWLRTGEGEMFAPMTRSEKIATFMTEVMMDPDDSFRKRFIEALEKLTADEWAILAAVAKKMKDD